jgi:hypothetical protein
LTRAKNALFSLESRTVSKFYGLIGLRPSSAPFLSIDNFVPLARHKYVAQSRGYFKGDHVEAGDIVFCSGYLVDEFLRGAARSIQKDFVLISGNGDLNIDGSFHDALPKNLVRWHAQNAVSYHERISPLPIGLENRALHSNGIIGIFRALRRKNIRKKNRLLYGFTVSTNAIERQAALSAAASTKLAVNVPRMNSRDYLKALAGYRFVVSPPGGGTDCHRTWEAMYLRVVPVVRRCYLTEFYRNLGLPMILVDTWTELLTWDEDYLDRQYRDLSSLFDSPALWHEYWENLILKEAR